MGRRLAIAGVGLAAVALVLTLVLWPGRAGVSEPFGVPQAGAGASQPTPSPGPADLELYGPRVELPGGLLLKQLGKLAEIRREEPGQPWTIRTVVDRIEVTPRVTTVRSTALTAWS